MLGLYADYSRHAVGNIYCGKDIYSGTYSSDVKCMYTSAPGYTVDYSSFIQDIYTDIVLGICT